MIGKGWRKRCKGCGLIPDNCNCGLCMSGGGCEGEWGIYIGLPLRIDPKGLYSQPRITRSGRKL